MTMNLSTILTTLALAATAAGCAAAETDLEARDARMVDELDGLDGSSETKAFDHYYTVRADVRRCAFPRCGGWFVTSVNGDPIPCADGTTAISCYVAELSPPRDVTVTDGDLVHGRLGRVSLSGETYGRLDVELAYEPLLGAAEPGERYGLFHPTDIVCVTTPCPTTARVMLNSGERTMGPRFEFAAGDRARNDRLEDAFWSQYEDEQPIGGRGVLTRGAEHNAGDGLVYSIYDIYTVKTIKPPYEPVCVVQDLGRRTTAWNFDSERRAAGLLERLEGQVTLMSGTCEDQQAAMTCTMEYAPVHGYIDDSSSCEVYPNDCQFRVGVITAAAERGKASGEWRDGTCFSQGLPGFTSELGSTEPEPRA